VPVRLCVSANADTTHRCHAGVFLSNMRSLASKLDELQVLMVKNGDFSISAVLCFTETWLCGLISDSALRLPTLDRNTELSGKTKGRGICFLH